MITTAYIMIGIGFALTLLVAYGVGYRAGVDSGRQAEYELSKLAKSRLIERYEARLEQLDRRGQLVDDDVLH